MLRNFLLTTFRNLIKNKNPLITSFGWSEEHIGWGNYTRTLKWGEVQKHEVRCFDVDRGYFETMGIELKEAKVYKAATKNPVDAIKYE